MKKVCLITTGQPSSNPRLVKEADALMEAGYQVQVVCCFWAAWAMKMDRTLLASRSWSCRYIGGDPVTTPALYYWTRFRHWVSRQALRRGSASPILRKWAFFRALPELERAAIETPAELYISHYPETLPVAVRAARKHKAKVGFDAEDFHTQSLALGNCKSVQDALIERTESVFLPQCDYVTASSPAIAEAYAAKYGIPRPATILNVFPLSMRPTEFRLTKKDGPLRLYWFSQTIGKGRGLEDIVCAMGALRTLGVELHLRGSAAPGYKEELFALSASVGLNANQIFVHVPGRPEEMVRMAAQYDVGLALERNTIPMGDMCLSNKIFTYLLAGNAVIATATRAQRWLMERINGADFCYVPGDVDALAQCLRRWCGDRTALETARCQSWDWGTRRYNWDQEKGEFLQIIGKILFTARD